MLTTVGSLASAVSLRIAGAGGVVGTLVVSLLVCGGVLASSRWARALMLLQAAGYAIGAVAAHVVGTVIATLTPSALAWHQENVRARSRRKAKSLADWRRDPA